MAFNPSVDLFETGDNGLFFSNTQTDAVRGFPLLDNEVPTQSMPPLTPRSSNVDCIYKKIGKVEQGIGELTSRLEHLMENQKSTKKEKIPDDLSQLQKFNGQIDFQRWVKSFEFLSADLSDEKKLRVLVVKTVGKANEIVIDKAGTHTYREIVADLSNRFSLFRTAVEAETAYDSRTRRSAESVRDFADDLLRIGAQAFPRMTEVELREKIMHTMMVREANRDVKLSMSRFPPSSLSNYLDIVEGFERIYKPGTTTGGTVSPVRPVITAVASSNSGIRCFKCQEFGHIARGCPKSVNVFQRTMSWPSQTPRQTMNRPTNSTFSQQPFYRSQAGLINAPSNVQPTVPQVRPILGPDTTVSRSTLPRESRLPVVEQPTSYGNTAQKLTGFPGQNTTYTGVADASASGCQPQQNRPTGALQPTLTARQGPCYNCGQYGHLARNCPQGNEQRR